MEKQDLERMGTKEELELCSEGLFFNPKSEDKDPKYSTKGRRLKPIDKRRKNRSPRQVGPEELFSTTLQGNQPTRTGIAKFPYFKEGERIENKLDTKTNITVCQICNHAKEDLTPSMICNQCIIDHKHNNPKKIYKYIITLAFLLLLIIIAILAYYLIQAKTENANHTKYSLGWNQSEDINYPIIEENEIYKTVIRMQKGAIAQYSIQMSILHKNIDNTNTQNKKLKEEEFNNPRMRYSVVDIKRGRYGLHNLAEKEREYYYPNELEWLIWEGERMYGFLSITWDDGIYFWRLNESSGYFSSRWRYEECSGCRQKRGVVHPNGIYIVGGVEGVKIYDISNISNIPNTLSVIERYEREGVVNTCFLYEYERALCADSKGIVTLHNMKRSEAPPDIFYISPTSEHYVCGVSASEGLVILGTLHGVLRVLAFSGIHTGIDLGVVNYDNNHSEINAVGYIGQGRIITVDGSACYLHFVSPYVELRTSTLLLHADWYEAIIPLQSDQSYFALGGRRNLLGFLDIYTLFSDNYTLQLVHSKQDIPHNGCTILAIKELREGAIVFGGEFCSLICYWNYALWPIQDPQCWDDLTYSRIYDFIPII